MIYNNFGCYIQFDSLIMCKTSIQNVAADFDIYKHLTDFSIKISKINGAVVRPVSPTQASNRSKLLEQQYKS